MKISKIVTLALTPVLLAGCGAKSMSRADALKKLEGMAEHDYSKDIENVKKLSVVQTTEVKGTGTGDGKLAMTIAFDLENAVMYESDVYEGAASAALGAGGETWTFVKENQLIMAQRSAGANIGTYQSAPLTEETAAQYAVLLASNVARFYGNAVELIGTVAETIEALNASESVMDSFEESYVDKGEGAMSVKVVGKKGTESATFEAEISNYIVTKISESMAAEGATETTTMDFKVGEASYSLPDITNWTPAN